MAGVLPNFEGADLASQYAAIVANTLTLGTYRKCDIYFQTRCEMQLFLVTSKNKEQNKYISLF